MLKAFSIFFFVAFSFAAQADDLTKVPLFEKWVSEEIKTLQQDTTIFNYHEDPSSNELAVVSNTYIPILTKLANRFFEEPMSHSAGAGLYFAVDPAASRTYGVSEHWVLTVATLKIGSRYFSEDNDFTTAIKEELIKFGCDFMDPNVVGLIWDQHVTCRNLVRDAFKKYHVQFLSYKWHAAQLTSCPGQRVLAVNLIDFSAADVSDLRVFTSNTKQGPEFYDERIRIQALYQESWQNSHEYISSYSGKEIDPLLWPDLPSGPPQDYQPWLHERIQGCNASGLIWNH
jgi:hypothetical protein